jgi:hypothetical protein
LSHLTSSARLNGDFGSAILSPWFAMSTLNTTHYDAQPMTWGLGGVLTLPYLTIPYLTLPYLTLPYQEEDMHPRRPALRASTDLSWRTGWLGKLFSCAEYELQTVLSYAVQVLIVPYFTISKTAS